MATCLEHVQGSQTISNLFIFELIFIQAEGGWMEWKVVCVIEG